MNNIRTIIFDYDGTLHQSMVIYEQAFRDAYQYLVDINKAPIRLWTQDQIKSFLGQNPKEMWKSLMLNLDDETIERASSIVSLSMKKQIHEGKAVLYHSSLEVLSYLKNKGYKLIYLSNSKRYYMDAHINAFHLHQYFDMMLCSEDFNYIPKEEIINQVKSEIILDACVIGDRIHDIKAGLSHQFYTIACDYGYGNANELKDANLHIHRIDELYNIF